MEFESCQCDFGVLYNFKIANSLEFIQFSKYIVVYIMLIQTQLFLYEF